MKLKKVNPIKIAFFSYMKLEFAGGLEKYILETSTALSKRYNEMEVSVITFDDNTLSKMLFIYSLYFFGKQNKVNENNLETRKIKEKLGNVKYIKLGLTDLKYELQKYDRLYISNNIADVLLIRFLVGFAKIPPVICGFHIPCKYIYTKSLQSKLHNIMYSSYPYRNALAKCKKIHVLNSFDEMSLKRYFPSDSVVKIYNPFDFDSFYRKSKSFVYKIKWNKDRIKILWVGRLTEQKGVSSLINIIKDINAGTLKEKILWNIIGDGELKNEIIKVGKNFDNVNYLGYIENDFLASIYHQNDLFISTSQWESFPYNILEAQCMGLPVVAFDIPGCRDIIDNNSSGYLVKNIGDFEDKIDLFIGKRPFNRNTIIKNIRVKFNFEGYYNKLRELFI